MRGFMTALGERWNETVNALPQNVKDLLKKKFS